MNKTNKILIIIIIFLLLILAGGGAFAYIYLGTDLLKSEKQLFFEYLGQVIDQENGFLEKNIELYNKKKNEQVYKNSGELRAKVNVDSTEEMEDLKEKINSVNNMQISFSGEIDSTKQIVMQDIKLDYGNDVVFPVKYMQNGGKVGLQTDFVGKKYIAIENNNLKALAQKLGVKDVSKIPDKIELTEEVEKIKFSSEELEQLKQIYGNVLNEQLSQDNFSKSRANGVNEYILSLTGNQIKNIAIKILEATKENTLLIDKINEYMKEFNTENTGITINTALIDVIINGINNDTETVIPDIKIILGQANKKLNKISLESDNFRLKIEKNDNDDKLAYKTGVAINIKNTGMEENMEANLEIACTYSGLKEMNDVGENYNISLNVKSADNSMGYTYDYNNSVQFVEEIETEIPNSDTIIVLNQYEKAAELLEKIGERLVSVNKSQMEKLGLKENENPLLYATPITMLAMYNMSSNSMQDADLSEYEKQAFNEKFTQFEGSEKKASTVNSLLTTVYNNNLTAIDEDRKVEVTGDVTVTTSQTTTPEKVDLSDTYSVTVKYDETGFVNEIIVTKN